jgi:signal transduction histidine kinase
MHLPARTQFTFAAVATALGTVLVVGFGWRALAEVNSAAELMEQQIRRIGRIERVEEEVHEFAARNAGANRSSLDRHLEELLAAPAEKGEVLLLTQLQNRVAEARVHDTAESWAQAAEVLSQMGKLAVADAARVAELTSGPAKSSARNIVRLGITVVLVGGALTLLAFGRHRRERREAEARLRRSDRLAALGMMAASVAHELNNPLATISGCASAVRDRLRRRGEELQPDEIEYLDMIVDESRRCSGITRSLRDLARESPPATTPSDLAALARDVIALAELAREGPRVTFELTGDPSLEVVCDPDKIKQLLLNLVVNARDACSDGGRVRVSVGRGAAESARLVVEDDGRGMTKDELGRLFEPFHTGKTRGLGLGLFLCERIATLHGGTILASSEGGGRGARFEVTLPLHPPLRSAAQRAAAVAAPA